ncbi:MAG: hypothetical protein ABIP06_14395 [Pyrinomonadaceae bacterium]
MTKTLNVNEISIQTVITSAKNGDEIVLEENGKAIAKIIPFPNAKDESWKGLFEAIEKNQIESDINDLADQHDHYLYGTPKRD